jgi:hypothetical protein
MPLERTINTSLLSALEARWDPAPVCQLAAATGMDDASVRVALKRLFDLGLVTHHLVSDCYSFRRAPMLFAGPAGGVASQADQINHPPHYTSDPSGVECITVTRHRNFNVGNAFKYLWRAGLKVNGHLSARQAEIHDLKKAAWYLADEIARLEAFRTGDQS